MGARLVARQIPIKGVGYTGVGMCEQTFESASCVLYVTICVDTFANLAEIAVGIKGALSRGALCSKQRVKRARAQHVQLLCACVGHMSTCVHGA